MRQRGPVIDAPRVVVAVLVVFVAIHLRFTLLPVNQAEWLARALAFDPERFSEIGGELPGGDAAKISQFLTYIFIHGDAAHLLINSAWFLAFGTLVARRIGSVRFLAFFLLCGIGAAGFYLAVNAAPMVGASGAISGLMGAALRFLFRSLSENNMAGLSGNMRHAPLVSLREALSDRGILIAAGGWTLLNIVFAWGASGLVPGAGIAWEAHLGGFYSGLLTFGLFDRPRFIHHDAALAE